MRRKILAESFREQLNDPLIFILFVAAAISLLLREYVWIWQLFWLWCCLNATVERYRG